MLTSCPELISPTLASSSEVYSMTSYDKLKSVKIAGLTGDQQTALVANKCLESGEAKCIYYIDAFSLSDLFTLY